MTTLILIAALSGYISISPIHILQPYHDVKCPHGYSIWWPVGKEFDDDRYAECIKRVVHAKAKTIVVPASKTERLTSNPHSPKAARKSQVSPVKLPALRELAR